jgi:bacteriocin biosynthesis cyclodehydratase domain-containing protein
MTDTRQLLVLTAGRFGCAVAERIAATEPNATIKDLFVGLPHLDELVASTGFVALALWRRYPAIADAVDAACVRHRVPWSSATLEGKHLVIGPLVTPAKGPCYACYRRRWAAHLAQPEREFTLDAAYESDDTVGVPGFPPGTATVAAAGLALDRADVMIASGRVRMLDLVRCTFEETRVVRVHGCERCGQVLPPGTRYVRHLLPALAADRQ